MLMSFLLMSLSLSFTADNIATGVKDSAAMDVDGVESVADGFAAAD